MLTTAVTAPELRTHWGQLQDAGHISSPFMTVQWLDALAAVPEVSTSMRVLRVVDGANALGYLPVELWRDESGARVLGPAGARWLAPDHVDVVAAPEHRAVVARAIADHLAGLRDWDVLDWEGLAGDGDLARAFTRTRFPRARRLPGRRVPVPFVTVRSADVQALFPSKNLRKQVTRGIREAQRPGRRLVVHTDPVEVLRALEHLVEIHVQHFGADSSLFTGHARRRFHQEAARRLSERGMVRLSVLEQDGEVAAALYALAVDDRLFAYVMGSRRDADGSPGRTLYGQMVLAAAQEGFTEVDLLRGDHDYKLRFATDVRQDEHLRIVRLSPRGLVLIGRRLPRWLFATLRRSTGRASGGPGDVEQD